MKNAEGEWYVAYHGVGDGQDSDDVKKALGLIYKGSFKVGNRQKHKNCPDQFHPRKKLEWEFIAHLKSRQQKIMVDFLR